MKRIDTSSPDWRNGQLVLIVKGADVMVYLLHNWYKNRFEDSVNGPTYLLLATISIYDVDL